jgi:tripeptidyl-peptidase-1
LIVPKPWHLSKSVSLIKPSGTFTDLSNGSRSAQYGKHWTTEEIHAKFAPSGDTVENVMTWLHENGYDGDRIASSASKGWLAFEATAREAECLFSTQYYEEENGDGSISIACDE